MAVVQLLPRHTATARFTTIQHLKTSAQFALLSSLHLHFHAHPRMDAALKQMLALPEPGN
jgi:hypothetical protein